MERKSWARKAIKVKRSKTVKRSLLEEKHGKPIEEIAIEAYNKHGFRGSCDYLDITSNTPSNWARTLGIVSFHGAVKKEKSEELGASMPKRLVKGPVSEEKEGTEEIKGVLRDDAFRELFVVASEEKIGEKGAVPVSVRITPSLNKLINELVLHPKLPYTDTSDFLRDAIFKYARSLTLYLKEQGFNIGKMLPFLSKL